MGVNRPRAACRRRRWSVRSIQVTIAIRSSSQVIRRLAHGRAGSSLFPVGPTSGSPATGARLRDAGPRSRAPGAGYDAGAHAAQRSRPMSFRACCRPRHRPSSSSRSRQDAEIPKSSVIRLIAMESSRFREPRTTSLRNSLGYGFRTGHILPVAPRGTTDQMSTIRAADPPDPESGVPIPTHQPRGVQELTPK